MTLAPKIRCLAEHEWAIYKDLRLAALAESPDAFGSTFAKEAQRSDAEWANRLTSGVNSSWDFPIVAEIDRQPIGLAWGRIEESNPTVANLYQVWVYPNYRRLGAGQLLLEAVTTWATGKQAHFLELGVTRGDTPAMRLYTRAGFEAVGQPQPIRPGAELLGQRMQLKLKKVTT
ncbi:MAG TPA: GNAT family N-acetyltransferase [Candidatus Limnocylindrales bacterium]|nr:GNAT family N-acetyltransferase [Candidatus Limnocylindrales bacterium]